MEKNKKVKKKYNTGDCFCRLWTVEDRYLNSVSDIEFFGVEQYNFFPVLNNCHEGFEPVCYDEGNGNCVCEDIKDLKVDCDGVYKICDIGYRCEYDNNNRKNERLKNTHECGSDFKSPCIGVCRKDTKNTTPNLNNNFDDYYRDEEFQRGDGDRDPACSCYFEPDYSTCDGSVQEETFDCVCTDFITNHPCHPSHPEFFEFDGNWCGQYDNDYDGCVGENGPPCTIENYHPPGECIPGPNPNDGICPEDTICVTNDLGLGGGGCYNPGDSNMCPEEQYPFGCNGQCKYIGNGGYYDVPGCMDPQAANYNPNAFWHDDSCSYVFLGCTDPTACNYDSQATDDNGACYYGLLYYLDTDGDGFGCPDLVVQACNNPDPNLYVLNGDGDCDDCPLNYDQCGVCGGDGWSCTGCTDESACNYDPDATFTCTTEDGVENWCCTYLGDPGAECSCDGSVELLGYFPDPDGDGIGCCFINGVFQGTFFCEDPGPGWIFQTCGEEDAYCDCPAGTHDIDDCGVCYPIDQPAPNECIGCTNPFAINYGIQKTIDDGSCTYDWSDTIYMKMFYWSDDGFCAPPRGICTYEVIETTFRDPTLPPDEPTPDYADPFDTPPSGDSLVDDTEEIEDVVTTVYTIEATEWECANLEELGIENYAGSFWEYDETLEQPLCDEENPYYTLIYLYPDGNFGTALTKAGRLCPGSWSWNQAHSAITLGYRSGTYLEIGNPVSQESISMNDLVDGFHGVRYRYQNVVGSETGELIPGKFYVRKWDFHPFLKGAPDGCFTDRVWSIDMQISSDPDDDTSSSYKTLPVFRSNRKWHSMNGNARGEYTITPSELRIHYNNATNNTCCFPDNAVYKEDSPLIGGGMLCESYDDNLEPHKFPGCRSVIRSMNYSVGGGTGGYRFYTNSQIKPGSSRANPNLTFLRKREKIYDIGSQLRDVTFGHCDGANTNMWFYGTEADYNDDALIPQRECIGLPFQNEIIGDINQDGVINVLDVISLTQYILNNQAFPNELGLCYLYCPEELESFCEDNDYDFVTWSIDNPLLPFPTTSQQCAAFEDDGMSGFQHQWYSYGDINQDGNVDILDIIELVNMILNDEQTTNLFMEVIEEGQPASKEDMEDSFNMNTDSYNRIKNTKQELTTLFKKLEMRLKQNKKRTRKKRVKGKLINKILNSQDDERNKLIQLILKIQNHEK